MRKYELTYLTAHEEGTEAKTVAAFLDARHAAIVSVHPWSVRRRLVHPIKKQDQAFYTTIVFQAEPTEIKPLEDALKLDHNIIRALIVHYEPGYFDRSPAGEESARTEAAKSGAAAPVEPVAPAPAALPKPRRPRKTADQPAADPKSLDEKIDELLKDDVVK